MDINIASNLSVGQVVKNYKELCELLGTDIRSGKSKKLQVEDWYERYFRFTRVGNKYIIEEIYDVPKPKTDKRKNGNNNHNVYGEFVQELIVNALILNNGNLLHTLSYFLNELCMTNENYSYYHYNQSELARLLDIDKFNVYYFYLTTSSNFRGIFERALKNLAKNQYIKWKKVTMIKSGFSHEIATPEEERIIQRAKETVLNDMGYKNMQRLNLEGKYNKYEEKLMEIIREELKIRIDYFYSAYQIRMVLVDDEKKQTDTALLKSKSKLNDLVIKKLTEQALNRQLGTIKKYEVAIGKQGKPHNQFDECKINDDYLKIYATLVSVLVNRDTKFKDIKKKIEVESGSSMSA